MRKAFFIFISIYLTILSLSAQEDSLRIFRDSLKIQNTLTGNTESTSIQTSPDERIGLPIPAYPADSAIQLHIQKPTLLIPYYTNPSPMFKGDYQTGGILFTRRNGGLIGAGGQTTLPGIGRSNNASISYFHAFNPRWTLQVGIDADKMLMAHFTGQSFGTSGVLSYQATNRLTFHLFGGYNSGYVPGMQSYRFGGSMDINIARHFGLEMGVQRYYNPMRGGWETVPIATPYYKFNNGAKIGFDVGGMIYEIFRNNSYKKNAGRMNPTIGPPRPRIEIR